MQNITFTTNVTKNTLEHVKLLLHSLKYNLDNKHHQILIFIDADNENVLDYLLSIKSDFKDMTIIRNTLPVPLGYQTNSNLLTEYAKYDIISYLQADMVVGPNYDTEVLRHAKKGRILSATRVEPPLHGDSPVTVTKNFGLRPSEFNLEEWNKFSNSIKRDELIDYFFAPITYYKEDWIKIGGYDTVFRRSREDSDFVQRCLHANIELTQTFSANVYHFTCVASRGNNWFDSNDSEAQERVELQKKADNIELMKFIRKWGNFNHGDSKLKKLDIDLMVKNCPSSLITRIEPFFSRVWVDTEQQKTELLSLCNTNHIWANKLMGYSDSDWERYNHLFRQEDFNTIFNVGTPLDYSVLLTIDFNKVGQGNILLANLQNLYDLFSGYESGEYELADITISIRKLQELPINIQNPNFDTSLLTIY